MNILNDINNILLENTKKDYLKSALMVGAIPLGVMGLNKATNIYHKYIIPSKLAYNITSSAIKSKLRSNVPE
jgi:hypothetical protein